MELGGLSPSKGDLGGGVPLRKFLGSKEYLDWYRKNFVLLNSMQESIEIQAWLLMTFFLSLHNQLTSIYCRIIKLKSAHV